MHGRQAYSTIRYCLLQQATAEVQAVAVQCMQVWGKLERVPRLPLDAALAVESGMLMLPALAQPSEDLAADLASVRQVTMPVGCCAFKLSSAATSILLCHACRSPPSVMRADERGHAR